jgi:para-nitrobenzyl esterase
MDFSHVSEDCLYLNIWVPEHGNEKLPVMVWVPGGAYAIGGCGTNTVGESSIYDSATLAKDTSCIIVTISYRLNVFGFLNLSGYSERFDDNLGMKDIITALKWVHQAIGDFDGDAGNVTLFGQSAGAGAVSALLLVEEAKPYFHKAIIQSNCFGSFYTEVEEKEITAKFLEIAGIEETNAEALLGLSNLQLMQAADLLEEYVTEHYFGRCTFCPIIDGKFIKEFPTIATFQDAEKPVMVGSNQMEGNFLSFERKWTEDKIDQLKYSLLRYLEKYRRDEILAKYPELPSKQSFSDLLTDVMYTIPKLLFAEHYSQKGIVYVYRFDYTSAVMKILKLYACHIAELFPLFALYKKKQYRHLFLGSKHSVEALGKRLRKYWGAFAHNGNPNADGLVEWKTYDENNRFTMVFNRKDRRVADADSKSRLYYLGISKLLITKI